jgi:hypothetical protein
VVYGHVISTTAVPRLISVEKSIELSNFNLLGRMGRCQRVVKNQELKQRNSEEKTCLRWAAGVFEEFQRGLKPLIRATSTQEMSVCDRIIYRAKDTTVSYPQEHWPRVRRSVD